MSELAELLMDEHEEWVNYQEMMAENAPIPGWDFEEYDLDEDIPF